MEKQILLKKSDEAEDASEYERKQGNSEGKDNGKTTSSIHMQCSFHLVIAKKLMRSDHVGKKKKPRRKNASQPGQGCGTTEARPWDN